MSKGVKAIAEGCRRLNFLRAADCKKIDDVGMVKIGENCPDMEELDLEDCKAVTDVGIMAIADGCTNLKNLKINRCKKVTNKGMIALSDNCRKLEELDVWHCPKLTDIRVEKLFVENPDDPPISQDEFEQQRLDYVGIVKIGENCPDMEELDLENCKAITDA